MSERKVRVRHAVPLDGSTCGVQCREPAAWVLEVDNGTFVTVLRFCEGHGRELASEARVAE